MRILLFLPLSCHPPDHRGACSRVGEALSGSGVVSNAGNTARLGWRATKTVTETATCQAARNYAPCRIAYSIMCWIRLPFGDGAQREHLVIGRGPWGMVSAAHHPWGVTLRTCLSWPLGLWTLDLCLLFACRAGLGSRDASLESRE